MAIDWLGKGFIVKKYKEGKGMQDIWLERSILGNKELFDKRVKYTIHNLEKRFNNMKVEVKPNSFKKNVEIKGFGSKADKQQTYTIRMGYKKLYMKIVGLALEEIMDCIE